MGMASPSLMELQVHDSISGHLQQLTMKKLASTIICCNPFVLAQTPIPSFVGNNYFCDTGNPGPGYSRTEVYQDNPLWDGEGCGPTSTCCQLNNPPWFCTTLPQPTTDDIELRICAGLERISDEDVHIQLVDIYIM